MPSVHFLYARAGLRIRLPSKTLQGIITKKNKIEISSAVKISDLLQRIQRFITAFKRQPRGHTNAANISALYFRGSQLTDTILFPSETKSPKKSPSFNFSN